MSGLVHFRYQKLGIRKLENSLRKFARPTVEIGRRGFGGKFRKTP